MFTDIVRSTEIAVELGDRHWTWLLAWHHELVRRELKRFSGREVDTAGDGFFAVFDSPARAVRCAEACVSSLRELGLEIRAGLHTGEVEFEGKQTRGVAVHLAARAMAEGEAGNVFVTGTVRDLVTGSGLAFEDRGVYELKGVPGSWSLLRLTTIDGRPVQQPLAADEAFARRASVEPARSPRINRVILACGAGAVAALALGLLIFAQVSGPTGFCAQAAAGDLLQQICDKGTLTVSMDPKYPPQSFVNKETGEYDGFDIDVAREIADRLGVQVEWQTPYWGSIVAGTWDGRWDASIGSMAITPERAEVLYFTPPYYYTPAAIAVHNDNEDIKAARDLSGGRVGVCDECTYDLYLQGELEIALDPSGTSAPVPSEVSDPKIITYGSDLPAIRDLQLGDGTKLDAVISALPTLQAAIDRGSPIKVVSKPIYFEPEAIAIDRSSQLDPTSLVDAFTAIVREMHDDGTLTELSMKWYDVDLSTGV